MVNLASETPVRHIIEERLLIRKESAYGECRCERPVDRAVGPECEELAYLERRILRHRVALSLSERCRIILPCADGLTSKDVAIAWPPRTHSWQVASSIVEGSLRRSARRSSQRALAML